MILDRNQFNFLPHTLSFKTLDPMDDKLLPSHHVNLLNMLFFLSRFSWFAVVLIPVLTALHTTHALVERALGQVDVVTSIEGVYDSNIFSSPILKRETFC